MRLTGMGMVALLALGCGDAEVVDFTQGGVTDAVAVPHGKEDNFLAVSAREYLVEGETTIVLDEKHADLTDSGKFQKAKRLVPYKMIAVAWFLNSFVAPKDKKDKNAKYGGFNALIRNGNFEDLDLYQVDDLTFRFTLRMDMGGPMDLMSKLPTTADADGAARFELQMGIPSNDELSNLAAGDEWFRQDEWKHWVPWDHAPEAIETIRLEVSPQERSMDAWMDYDRLFADGKVTIGVHFGWDYHEATHVKESKMLFEHLVKDGYEPPVADWDRLERNSGPFEKTIQANGKPLKIEISIFHGKPGTKTDPDTDQGGRWLKKDLIKSLETREVIIYSGHSGPWWGFSMGNWKKTEEGELDDNEITMLDLPDHYQVVLAEGCETYAIGQAFFDNPAKQDRTNIDVVTTTTYSTAGDADPVKDFLNAVVGTWTDGTHAPMTYSELLLDLDYNAWDSAMYGVHGIDDNPHLHPYADPDKFCAPCSWDEECGAEGNFCVNLGTDGQFCTGTCTADDGCPDGYTCAAVARGQSITGRACVPRHFSCTDETPPSHDVIINEVLADPANDETGDVNGDGWYDKDEDEFIELVNTSNRVIDLSGWTVADGTTVRFTFPEGVTLKKKGAAVVFGGGDTAWLLFVSDEGLRLSNAGDTVVLRTAEGEVVDRMVYGKEADQDRSLVRATDGDPDAEFVLHPGTEESATPGWRTDGYLFQ